MPRRNPDFSPTSESTGQDFKDVTERLPVVELTSAEQAEEILSKDKVQTGPQSLEFGTIKPAADLEYTVVAHGDKTGAVKIERNQAARPEDIDMPPEIVRTQPRTESKLSQAEVFAILDRNIKTIQKKLHEDTTMAPDTRAIYEEVLKTNNQKLRKLTGGVVSKDRGLTTASFDQKLHQETAEDRAIMQAKSQETFTKNPAMTGQELEDWTKRISNKNKTGQYQASVKIEQYRKRRNKQLTEGIGENDAAWFHDDSRETYLNRAKPEKKPAKTSFFSRVKTWFKA